MKYKISELTEADLKVIDDLMKQARYERISESSLQHNHADKLRHWLSDEFLLYRAYISVDHYIALDLTLRGDGQFLPFSMCREATSDNYTYGNSAYYLTLNEIVFIKKAMELIQAKF